MTPQGGGVDLEVAMGQQILDVFPAAASDEGFHRAGHVAQHIQGAAVLVRGPAAAGGHHGVDPGLVLRVEGQDLPDLGDAQVPGQVVHVQSALPVNLGAEADQHLGDGLDLGEAGVIEGQGRGHQLPTAGDAGVGNDLPVGAGAVIVAFGLGHDPGLGQGAGDLPGTAGGLELDLDPEGAAGFGGEGGLRNEGGGGGHVGLRGWLG